MPDLNITLVLPSGGARAAEVPGVMPHLLALLWQLLWVALFLRIASNIFRKSVLKSGPVRRRQRKTAKA